MSRSDRETHSPLPVIENLVNQRELPSSRRLSVDAIKRLLDPVKLLCELQNRAVTSVHKRDVGVIQRVTSISKSESTRCIRRVYQTHPNEKPLPSWICTVLLAGVDHGDEVASRLGHLFIVQHGVPVRVKRTRPERRLRLPHRRMVVQ